MDERTSGEEVRRKRMKEKELEIGKIKENWCGEGINEGMCEGRRRVGKKMNE